MSPKELMPGNQVLEEAEKLKDNLLEVELRARNLSTERETALVKLLTHETGYDALPSINDEMITDTRIEDKEPVISPRAVDMVLGRTAKSIETVDKSRTALTKIVNHEDDRLAVIVGPCSIHDPKATLEYADYVAEWRDEFGSDLEIVMRTYLEKPRTELGWKGFIYDPKLDGSDDLNTGIIASRILLNQITEIGVPVGTERLNALTPQFLNGLVSYDSIGARNVADQKQREYGSGTSSVIGAKNGTNGDIRVAAEAVVAIRAPHSFLGMSPDGTLAQVKTMGNNTAHVILRGSDKGPNYSAEHIEEAKAILRSKKLQESLVIDASHGNSGKKADKQNEVVDDICRQVSGGEQAIRGAMIESNIKAGKQKLDVLEKLEYGVSVTDECVDLVDTHLMLTSLSEAVRKRRSNSNL